VYDAEDIAKNIRETFTKKPVKERKELPFTWPQTLQHVGDSLAVAYASDKWKDDGNYETYKHIAESHNRVLVKPGLLRDYYNPESAWGAIGPTVDFGGVPMPREIATLGFFEEANLKLFGEGTNEDPEFSEGRDAGVVKVTVAHALLGGSKILWSQTERGGVDQPFIFVYSEKDGVLMIMVGEELDIEADGIVG
jgi:hypothetical protein